MEPSQNSFPYSEKKYIKKNRYAHHADPDNEIRPAVACLIKWVEERGSFRESKNFLDEPFGLKKIEVCQLEDLFVERKYVCWQPVFKETCQGNYLQIVYHAPQVLDYYAYKCAQEKVCRNENCHGWTNSLHCAYNQRCFLFVYYLHRQYNRLRLENGCIELVCWGY